MRDAARAPLNSSTGYERRDLLAELRMLKQERVLAALELLLLLLLMLLVLLLVMVMVVVVVVVMGMGMGVGMGVRLVMLVMLLVMLVVLLVVVVMLMMLVMLLVVLMRRRRRCRCRGFLRFRIRALVENANRAVLADPVGDLRRVDPHRQLAGEQAVQYRRSETNVQSSLSDHRIHLSVDADATITGAPIRCIWKPMVPVTSIQNFRQRGLEHLELKLRELSCL